MKQSRENSPESEMSLDLFRVEGNKSDTFLFALPVASEEAAFCFGLFM